MTSLPQGGVAYSTSPIVTPSLERCSWTNKKGWPLLQAAHECSSLLGYFIVINILQSPHSLVTHSQAVITEQYK